MWCAVIITCFRVSTFAQLCLQVDQINKMNGEDAEEDAGVHGTGDTVENGKTSFLDVINGTGEISLREPKVPKQIPDPVQKPYKQR